MPQFSGSFSLRQSIEIGLMLGWQDLRQAYRRSKLGQFWITAGMMLQIATIGVVFGLIFKVPLQEYLPFVSTGVILWGLVSSSLNEGSMTFITSEALIKQLRLPPITHIVRVMWKSLLTFGHNLIILPIVFLLMGKTINPAILLFFPGLVIVIMNLSWMVFILATISSRFRDIPPIISSITLMLFYVTPVMWYPSSLSPQVAHLMLGLNPFYHFYQLLRQPVMGELPTFENYAISIGFCLVGVLLALAVNGKTSKKIAFWV
jgi:ABC-type polysaccharide/polyol phosphate export permease